MLAQILLHISGNEQRPHEIQLDEAPGFDKRKVYTRDAAVKVSTR
jgi:hypothetical protein